MHEIKLALANAPGISMRRNGEMQRALDDFGSRLIAAEVTEKLAKSQDALIKRFCARLKAAERIAYDLNDAVSNYDMPNDFVERAENALAAWRKECGE